MRSLLILVPILLILTTCGPTRHHYRFHVETYRIKKDDVPQLEPTDSVKVLFAITTVDSSKLNRLDKIHLEQFTRKNDMVLDYRKDHIRIEKYEKDVSSNEVVKTNAEIFQQKRELSQMYFDGKQPNYGGSARNTAIAIGAGGIIVGLIGLIAFALAIRKAIDDLTSNCYIATVCYGDINAEEVETLRRWRDQVLKKHFLGRMFIRLYYTYSPAVARFLKNKSSINRLIRKMILDPLVRIIRQIS